MTEDHLGSLYQQAQAAIKARDYDYARHLLTRILSADENYKDASRLLARLVQIKRRRWYNHPMLWGSLGFAILAAAGFLLVPRLRGSQTVPTSAHTATDSPTPALSPIPPAVPTATETLPPTPTPLPLTWKRISTGQEFERDAVTAFATDRKDPEVIYASMKNSGVYKTIDGGLSWRPAHQGLSNAQVESLVIDSQNPRILYAGTMSGVFKTEDGGETWLRIGEGTYLLMDAQDNSHLYARNANGIYETTDQGSHWEVVYSPTEDCPGKIQAWAIHPTEGRRLFIAGEKCAGIYQSSDSGKTWTLMGGMDFSNITSLTVGVDEQGTAINYAFSEGEWYESSDGGAAWSGIEIPAYQMTDLMVDGDNPSISYLASVTSIFVRQGRGAWQRIPNSQSRMYSAIHIDHPNGVTRIITSATDVSRQSDPNVGIFISTDEGTSWVEQENGIGSARAELKIDPGGDRMYLASYYVEMEEKVGCTLFRSPDNGKSWTIIYEAWDPPSWCGPAFDAANALHLMETGRFQKAWNGGDTWLWYMHELTSYDPKTGTSKDDSLAFALPSYYKNGVYLEGSQSVSANPFIEGFVYDVGDAIYYSTDAGKSWQRSEGSEGSWDARLFYANQSETIFSIGAYHQKYSNDNGKTWQNCGEDVFASRSDTRLALDLQNSRLYLAAPGQGVLVSTDDCQSWLASNEGLESLFVNTLALDPNHPDTVYAGTDGGAYVSFDGGQRWNQINDGLLGATVVYSIVVDKDSTVYAATPYGIFKLEGK